MTYKYSQTDKEFDVLRYVGEEMKANIEPLEDGGMVVKNAYLPQYDGIIIYPKGLTGEECDFAKSDLFAKINTKHRKGMKYTGTQLIRLIEELEPTKAKNKAKQFKSIECEEINPQGQQEVASLFLVDENNKMQKRWENMDVLLRLCNIVVRYNEMSKKIEFAGVEHMEDMADTTFTRIRSYCLDHGFKANKDEVYEFVQVVASHNRYNPIAEYLNDCKAKHEPNGYEEIARLLGTIKYNTSDKERVIFCNNMLMKWFVNCVHIAFNNLGDERTCEIVPTFQGEQGKGKSKWAKSLVPKGYFKGDVILNLENKDNISDVLSHWIVELGEISGTFKKSETNKLKAFITSDKDTWRNPYGRCNNTYPRRTSFIATVNDREFLVDKTGNRRFIVLPAESLNYQHDVNVDKFWGEVMHLYSEFIEKKSPFYMTQEEQKQNEIYNSDYTTKTDTELILDDLFDWESRELGACKLADIVTYANEKTHKHYSPNAIKQVLKNHGCEYAKFTAGEKGNRKQDKYWKIPFTEGLTLPF